MAERPPATFKTDPHPYEVPDGEAGEGVSLSLNDEGTLAYVTAYDRHLGADGTTRDYSSQSTPLTARQLRTLATDAMAMAADMLVEEERTCMKCGAPRGTPGECSIKGKYSGPLHQW